MQNVDLYGQVWVFQAIHTTLLFFNQHKFGKKLRWVVPQISKTIGKSEVFPLIIGDSAFPFSVHLMKPFAGGELNEKQKYFNYRLSRSRMAVGSAFGQLKSRWRVLYKKCESSKETVKLYALVCIILHNICIQRGETLFPQLDLTVDRSTYQ